MNLGLLKAICISFLGTLIYESTLCQRIIPLHFPEKFSKRVAVVIEDSDNFLWIGTNFGLYQYDAERIIKFLSSNSTHSIPDDNVLCLAEDKNSNIWIGTEGGLALFNKNSETTIFPGNWIEGLNGTITSIKYNNLTGKMFICNNKGEIFILSKGSQFNIEKIKLLRSTSRENYISDLLFDHKDSSKIWISTHSGIIEYNLRNKQKTEHKNLTRNDQDDISRNLMLNCLLNDTINDCIWVGSWGGGVMKFNTSTGEWSNFYFHNNTHTSTKNIVLKIGYYKENELLICSPDSGLLIFNIITEKFRSLKNKFFADIAKDMGECIAISKGNRGYWWIGYQKGLSFLNDESNLFQNYELTSLKGCISSICNYSKNEIIIGNIYDKNELMVWNLETQSVVKKIKCAHSNSFIKKIFSFNRGFYYLSDGFLYEIDVANSTSKKLSYSKKFPELTGRFRDIIPCGSMLFAVDENNLFYTLSNDFSLKKTYYSYASLKTHEQVNQIFHDGKNLIFSTKSKIGVLDLQTDDFYLVNGLTKNDYKPEGFTKDKSGKLWCGSKSSAGLISFKYINDTLKWWKNYNTEAGINSNNLWDLTLGDDNQLWFLSDNGIYSFNIESEVVKNYGADYGLPTHKADMINHSFNENTMVIGGCGFLSIFNKKIASKYPQNNQPRLTRMKVLGKNKLTDIVPQKDTVYRLNYNENQIEFEFTAFNYGENKSQTYFYQLKGLDGIANKTNQQNSVHYSNLAAGDYKFCVSTQTDVNHELSQDQHCVSFTIAPPFWETIYFYILLFVFAVSAVIIVFYFKIKQVKKKQLEIWEQNKRIAELEMKALKAQMNPHFIFNCLNSINRYIIKNEPEIASDYLAKFSKLIRFMLDQSSLAEIPLSREIETLKLYMEMESLRFDKKFEFRINIDNNIQTDSLLIPPMLIQPYVENAIWHGLMHKKEKGILLIDIANEGDILSIFITDNGIGRKKAAEYKSKSGNSKKSYGMTLNQERLKIFQSTYNKIAHADIIDLFDETSQASGTRVILKIQYNIHESNHY